MLECVHYKFMLCWLLLTEKQAAGSSTLTNCVLYCKDFICEVLNDCIIKLMYFIICKLHEIPEIKFCLGCKLAKPLGCSSFSFT